MYEDRPEKDTPPSILKDLREYGGLSPDGQPIWRLVLAENVLLKYYHDCSDESPPEPPLSGSGVNSDGEGAAAAALPPPIRPVA